MPATVILGLFGTSIQGLPLYQPAGFVIMLAAIVLISGSILLIFQRRGWL